MMPLNSFISTSGVPYGQFEVWWHEPSSADADYGDERGWYWWPVNHNTEIEEPRGPFETEAKAIADAQEHAP